jgi:hypothetical protein
MEHPIQSTTVILVKKILTRQASTSWRSRLPNVKSSILLWLQSHDHDLSRFRVAILATLQDAQFNYRRFDREGRGQASLQFCSSSTTTTINLPCKEVARNFIQATSAASLLFAARSTHVKLSARKSLSPSIQQILLRGLLPSIRLPSNFRFDYQYCFSSLLVLASLCPFFLICSSFSNLKFVLLPSALLFRFPSS